MKAYINAISAIGFQDLIDFNKGISGLQKINANSGLIQPDYKEWINPMQLRRMSKIVRMGLGCTKSIVNQIGTQNFDSIIVGTGLGCIQDTVKFIDTINAVSTSSIPPTSFIQSTHNTMAGQIALLLENNNYNMTYVQNGVSFEHALIDGFLKIAEGQNNVLVGGLDEMTDYLQELALLAGIKNPKSFTEGSAFFNLSNKKDNNTFAKLCKSITYTINQESNLNEIVNKFLASENLSLENIDLFMQASPTSSLKLQTTKTLNSINFEEYCGKYFTSSAFALYLACLLFKENVQTINTTFDTEIEKLDTVLIVNNYMDKVVGLTLLSK